MLSRNVGKELPLIAQKRAVLSYGSAEARSQAQMKVLHALSTNFHKIHFYIIFPAKPRFSKCSLSFKFPRLTLSVFLFH